MIIKISYISFLILFTKCESKSKTLDVKKTLVFGPGIHSEATLPVRYFYLQAVDTNGNNFTRSPGKDHFSLQLHSSRHGQNIRHRPEILDRNDGSLLFRYRLFTSEEDMRVEVKYKGQHVANSPYTLTGMTYHDKCNCPEQSRSKWAREMACPKTFKQIEHDFKEFPEIDLEYVRKEGRKRFGGETAICYYSIIKSQLYRKCFGSIDGFKGFIDDWLFSIMRKVKLPDLEFWFNLSDWPKSTKGKPPFPVISWGKDDGTYDLVIPTYDLTNSVLLGLDRQSLDMMAVQGNTGPKWKKKESKAFFRGRDSRQERLDLVKLGNKDKGLFDVGITRYFFFRDQEAKIGTKSSVSFFDFFNYKYQLNIDGTVAAYRFPYLLMGDSVVFKQDSPFYEHFYSELEPWKHYIPFKRDLSDLEKQLKWARANDKEAKKIGQAGQTFARDNLMSDKLYCYTLRVLQQYAKRQKGKPMKHDDMEHIGMPKEDCNCQRNKSKKKAEL